MNFDSPVLPVVAIATGIGALAIWTIVLVKSLRALADGQEHRKTFVMMAGAATLASLGSLASSIGYAIQLGLVNLPIPLDALTLTASVGRGALLMSGLIVATHYRPPKAHP